MHRVVWSSLSILALWLPLSAHAQSGSVLERVRAQLIELQAPAFQERTIKAQGFLAEGARLRKRLEDVRRQCGEELRRSNRDAQLTTYLRCLRSLLLQESRIAQMHLSMDGAAQKSGSAWIDAVATMVDALDTNVFDTRARVDASMARLHRQYRVPFLIERLRLWMHRCASWSQRIVDDVSSLLQTTTLGEADRTELDEGLQCLSDALSLLHTAEAQNGYKEINIYISQFETAVPGCLEHIRHAGQEAPQTPPSPPPATE